MRITYFDVVTTENHLVEEAVKLATELGNKPSQAFKDIKLMLREAVCNEMKLKEKDSINRFVEIWYSDSALKNLLNIKVH